ncbi:MAG: hypothetical protein R3256_04430 [Thalassovita sp.]|nr:hypothetical protein [Thalassovita sp.]
MSRKRSPLFLERRSYRLRRVMDAAKLMPFLGAALWGVPVLWPGPGENVVSTSRAIFYLFLVWAVLIAVTMVLTFWLDDSAENGGNDGLE